MRKLTKPLERMTMTKKRRLAKEAKELQFSQDQDTEMEDVASLGEDTQPITSKPQVEEGTSEDATTIEGEKEDDNVVKEPIGVMLDEPQASGSEVTEEDTWENSMIMDIRECVQELISNDETEWSSYSKIILSTISRMAVLASSQYMGKKGQTVQQEELQKDKKIDWKTEKMKFILNSFKIKVEGEQISGKESKNWEKEFKNFSGKTNMEKIVSQVFHKKLGFNLEELKVKIPTTSTNSFPFYNENNYKWGTIKCGPDDEATRQDIRNQVKLVCGPTTLVTLHTVFGVFVNKEEMKHRMKDLQVLQHILVTTGEHGANSAIQWEQICNMIMQNWNMLVAVEHHPGMLNRTQVYQWVHSILIMIHDHFPRDTLTEHKLSKILGIAMLANHRNEELLKAIHELLPNYLTLPDHIGHNMVINRHDPTQVESNTYQFWKNQQVSKKVSVMYNELEMAKDIWPIQAWVKDETDVQPQIAPRNYSYQTPGKTSYRYYKNKW